MTGYLLAEFGNGGIFLKTTKNISFEFLHPKNPRILLKIKLPQNSNNFRKLTHNTILFGWFTFIRYTYILKIITLLGGWIDDCVSDSYKQIWRNYDGGLGANCRWQFWSRRNVRFHHHRTHDQDQNDSKIFTLIITMFSKIFQCFCVGTIGGINITRFG